MEPQLHSRRKDATGRLISSISVLLLGLQLAACDSGLGIHEQSWSEDVKLDDGSVISIDRNAKFKQSDALGGGAYSATELEATLSFRGALASLPTWNVPLIPVVLYREAGTKEWVLVATTTKCEVWYKRGRPLPPYWEFRLRPSGWEDVALSDRSIGRRTNLFFKYDAKLPAKHLTLSMKEEELRDSRIAEEFLRVATAQESEKYCGLWPRDEKTTNSNEAR